MRTQSHSAPVRKPVPYWVKPIVALCVPILLAIIFAGPGATADQGAAVHAEQAPSGHAGHAAAGAAAPMSGANGALGERNGPNAIIDVNIQTYAFSPQNLTVNVGDTVRWTNRDADRHTVTANNGAFDSGEFGQNGTFQFTFTTPGTYTYYCARHTSMTGTITVVGGSTATPTPAATGTPNTTTTPGATQTAGATGTANATTTGTPPANCSPSAYADVSINESGFNPASLTIAPGTRVTWTNTGTSRHRVRDINHSFLDSDDLQPGQSYSYTFCAAGTYLLEDARSSARSTIVVQGAAVTTTPGATGTPGTGTPQPTGTPQGGIIDVQIVDERFSPAFLTIQAGTTVRWTNYDHDTHTVTSPGNFNSGDIRSGQVYQYTFNTPGAFDYFCAYHANEMTGRITVTGQGGTPTPQPSNTPASGTVDVAIQNFAFVPANLTIQVGTTVRWTNQDSYPHTATSDNGVFDSGTLNGGQSYSYMFNTPGDYAYHCGVHPAMTGVIHVVTGGGGTPQPSQTAPATGTAQPSRTVPATGTPQATHTAQATATAQRTETAEPSHTAQRTETAEPSHTAQATTTAESFSDVLTTDYFYTPVRWLVHHNAVSGYADGTFRPYNQITRGQITKVIVLAQGWALANPPAATFGDVPVGSAFFAYVETGVQHGIISGYADGTFHPNANVTRGQIAKIIALARGWALLNPPTATFSDVPAGSVFFPYIETAVDRQVLSGYADGTFRPANNATRGQSSKIIYNAVTGP